MIANAGQRRLRSLRSRFAICHLIYVIACTLGGWGRAVRCDERREPPVIHMPRCRNSLGLVPAYTFSFRPTFLRFRRFPHDLPVGQWLFFFAGAAQCQAEYPGKRYGDNEADGEEPHRVPLGVLVSDE